MKTLQPFNDRIVIRRKDPQQLASGIVIPPTAAEKLSEGVVLAVGPGRRDDRGALVPMSVSEGDQVLFGRYAGQTVKFDGEELLVMREEDLLGRLI